MRLFDAKRDARDHGDRITQRPPDVRRLVPFGEAGTPTSFLLADMCRGRPARVAVVPRRLGDASLALRRGAIGAVWKAATWLLHTRAITRSPRACLEGETMVPSFACGLVCP